MRTRVAILVSAILVACAADAASPATTPAAPDIVLLNGMVLSVDVNDTVYEAVAIKGRTHHCGRQ
ncbi:MAG: hypothetical protein WDO68_26325 [Gammaproteobacteria bacterium]